MKSINGKVAAITGAASGIGRATAVRFAREGCHVAISDVDEKGLAETAEACGPGARVLVSRVDVADRAAMEAWAAEVREHFGTVNVIVNNAGVALGATVEDLRYEDFHWLMNINFWGVVHGTKAFLPHLKAAGEGHIVNISSVCGLVGMATLGAYSAAKFAVKGFSEALLQELEVEGCGVGVTTVHPGGIKTAIVRNARMIPREGWLHEGSASEFDKVLSTSPEYAAEEILQAILRKRRRQLIGRDAKLVDFVQRLLPSLSQGLLVGAGKRQRQQQLGASKRAAGQQP